MATSYNGTDPETTTTAPERNIHDRIDARDADAELPAWLMRFKRLVSIGLIAMILAMFAVVGLMFWYAGQIVGDNKAAPLPDTLNIPAAAEVLALSRDQNNTYVIAQHEGQRVVYLLNGQGDIIDKATFADLTPADRP